MNPAALKTNLKDLEPGGILIVNEDAFGASDLRKAGYETNPLEDGSPGRLPPHRHPDHQAQPRGRRRRQAQPARGRPLQELLRPGPGLLALRTAAGADAALDPRQVRQEASGPAGQLAPPSRPATTTARRPRLLPVHYRVAKAELPPGSYRKITGNEALALGLVDRRPAGRHAAGLRRLSRSRRPATSCTTSPS